MKRFSRFLVAVVFGLGLSSAPAADSSRPSEFNEHLNAAQALFQEDKLKEALAEIRAAGQAAPSRYEAKTLEALVRLKGGRPSAARQSLEEARLLVPTGKQVNLEAISKLIKAAEMAETARTAALSAPSDQGGLGTPDAGKLEVLRGQFREADQAPSLPDRQAGMADFLRQSASFARDHPERLQIWLLRAAAAGEVNDFEAGRVAGRKIMALVEGTKWAPGKPAFGQAFTVSKLGLEMRPIPSGTFLMGSPPDEPNRQADEVQHEVILTKPFWLGRTVVTQGQWKALMGTDIVAQDRKAHPAVVPFYPHGGSGDEQPIYFVSWYEAMAFCRKLTERARADGTLPEGYEFTLPTEAQWEYACRAGTTGATYLGPIHLLSRCNAPALDPIAWYAGNSSVGYQGNGCDWDSIDFPEKEFPGGLVGPHDVALKQPNAWGLYDMLGNVFEWCRDWAGGAYPSGSATDPTGPEKGALRVGRGGSWNLYADYCRAAYRDHCGPALRYEDLGFRVALSSSESQGPGDRSVPTDDTGDMLQRLDLRQVKVGGELGRRIDLTVKGNLLKIDIDKDFLAPLTGGKYTGLNDGSGPFIGIGKTLDGMVHLAAYTGDEALIARKNHLVASIIESQDRDGYIGMMAPERRTWTLWDLSEQAFILTALVSDYRLFESRNSLAAACKLADYVIKRWPGKPRNWQKGLPVREFMADLGLSDSFLSLSAATGDQRYLDFASYQLGTETWNLPIVLGRHPPIEGHVYTYLSNCFAQLELYRSRPDPELLTPVRRAVDFMTRKDGMTITGGVGQDECWTDNQDGSRNLGETCATTYQIFVFDSLMRLDGDSRWGDLIERILYNAACGAQSPDGRRIRYFTPFEGQRVYFAYDTYCCPGNFRRLMGTVPQLIYYRAGNGLAVNLYTASRATLDQVGGTTVTVSQETDYPSTGRITLRVEPRDKVDFPIILRIPRWSSQASVSVNGKPFSRGAKAGEYLGIERVWRPGDQVTIDLPMPWRFVAGRKSQKGRAAVMRGPVVYTLDPSHNPELAGVDLKRLVILPRTAELVRNDPSVRPGGTACRIRADLDAAGKGALSLILTEFPDPDGQAIYFQLSDPKAAVDDELLGAGRPEAGIERGL